MGVTPNEQPAPLWARVITTDFCTRTEESLVIINDEYEGLTFEEIAEVLELVYVHGVLGDQAA